VPIYDYRCDHCGHAFSAVQSFKEEALTACPSCGKPPRRLLSKPAIVFKGSGWYINDSRGASSGSAASSSDSGTPSGKTEKKDAQKSAESTSGTTEKPATS
jgi:putative FmdB family regulatory protein